MTWERKVLVDSVRLSAERHPNVHLDLHRLSSSEQLQALNDGRIQIGFIVMVACQDPTFVYEMLGWEPLVVGLPQQHHLAKGVAFRELQGRMPTVESIITYRRDVRLEVVLAFLKVVREIVRKGNPPRPARGRVSSLIPKKS